MKNEDNKGTEEIALLTPIADIKWCYATSHGVLFSLRYNCIMEQSKDMLTKYKISNTIYGVVVI